MKNAVWIVSAISLIFFACAVDESVPSQTDNLNIEIYMNTKKGFDVHWSKVSSATSYDIYYTATADPANLQFCASVEETTEFFKEEDSITPEQDYTFGVKARNYFGTSDMTVKGVTSPALPTDLPDEAESIFVTPNSLNYTITINWHSNNPSSTTWYNIYAGTSSPPLILVAKVTGTSYACTDIFIKPDLPQDDYYFAVEAENAIGTSSKTTTSDTTSIPLTSHAVPGTPSGLAVSAVNAVTHSCYLSWSAPSPLPNSPVIYDVFASPDTSPAYAGSTNQTAMSLTFSGAATYYFKVVARNELGSSPPSTIISQGL